MKPILKTIERIAVAAGLLLTVLVVLELVRAYEILYELHPWAGYGFLGLIGLLILYLIWQIRYLFTLRTAPHPPELPAEAPFDPSRARRFVRYMKRVSGRMEQNPELLDEFRPLLWDLRGDVAGLDKLTGDPDRFREAITAIERDRMAPMLAHLDRLAEAVVSDNVGIVSIGTALSPYRSFDLYIVLARNFRMVNRILRIYRTRPTPRETWAVFYDIARVVSAVNLLNAMDNVWAGIGRHVPLVGRYGEAISEAVFSGLLTSVAGHAAIDRCRSYRSWSNEEAVRKYRGRLVRWGRDVWNILMRHGIDKVFGRHSGSSSKSTDSEQGEGSGEESGEPRKGPLQRLFGGKRQPHD